MSVRQPDVVGEYDRLAARYDRRWSAYIRATTDETARRLGLQSGDCLLDVGCGTGALLRRLAGQHADVKLTGIDPSREMLAVARGSLPASIRLEEGFAERLPFAHGAFDVVVSSSAFHYFTDPACALAEMKRVLRPRGRVVVTDWCDDFFACRLCDRWLRWVDAAHTRVYSSAECRAFLAAAGFAEIEIDTYKINWLWGLMTAAAVRG